MGKKFFLGLLTGALVGAAAVCLSDENRRKKLLNDLSDTVNRTQDDLLEAYKDAKEKYYEYRRKLRGTTDEILADIDEELVEELGE